MIPSWAHAYSSYMNGMQHYVSVENYISRGGVDDAITIINGVANVQSGHKRRRLSVRQLATRLYKYKTANVNIYIWKDAIEYKMQKKETIEYTIINRKQRRTPVVNVPKNDWFDKLLEHHP